MNQNANTLPRRSFLTGLASVVGATALSPSLSAAGEKSSMTGTGAGHQLYFWDGESFVTSSDPSVGAPVGEAVRIQIQRIGHVASYSGIDVLLPGGPFHALSGHEDGAAKARFSTHLSSTKPLALRVRSGDVVTHFDLPLNARTGLELRYGTYLLTRESEPVRGLHLHRESATPVIDGSGHPLHGPHTLIDISPA